MTNVLRFPAAELAFEADPVDVARDIDAGTTSGFQLVETRGREAFALARIPGAINLPHWEMDERSTASLHPGLVYVCYCESFQCNAAAKGAMRLAQLGFRVKRLAGGITAWQAAGLPVEGTRIDGVSCAC
jgi:rhodanese-related sulfurtransferase